MAETIFISQKPLVVCVNGPQLAPAGHRNAVIFAQEDSGSSKRAVQARVLAISASKRTVLAWGELRFGCKRIPAVRDHPRHLCHSRQTLPETPKTLEIAFALRTAGSTPLIPMRNRRE
jgi:hypothetical protein